VTIETLRRSADFRRVSAQGKVARAGGLRLQWLRNGLDRNRYGVAATTATGGAVVRNRIRRWARELLRSWDSQLAQGFDIVVLAFNRESAESYQHFSQSLSTCLQRGLVVEGSLVW
jgi:ribonuclease P protein component